MASRILTCFSCTIYIFCLVILSTFVLTSILVGFVGLGLYIPTYINYQMYDGTQCYIFNHEYDTCDQRNSNLPGACYSTMWSVEYTVSNSTIEYFAFSTITEVFTTSKDALERLKSYRDANNYTCYYRKTQTDNVQWNRPASPRSYFILMIVGLSFTVVYFIIMGIIGIYQCRRK